jgi:hypothetical protein
MRCTSQRTAKDYLRAAEGGRPTYPCSVQSQPSHSSLGHHCAHCRQFVVEDVHASMYPLPPPSHSRHRCWMAKRTLFNLHVAQLRSNDAKNDNEHAGMGVHHFPFFPTRDSSSGSRGASFHSCRRQFVVANDAKERHGYTEMSSHRLHLHLSHSKHRPRMAEWKLTTCSSISK